MTERNERDETEPTTAATLPPAPDPGRAVPALEVGEVLGEAWRALVRDLAPYVVATLVYSAIVLVTCGLAVLIGGPLFGGLVVMALRSLRGETPTFDDVFAGFGDFGPLLLLSLVAGVLVALGLLFCLLPGLYLCLAWIFAPFLVIDRKMDFWDAMSLSMRTVNAHFVPVAAIVLVLTIINLAGGTIVLGFVLTQPLMVIGLAVAYRRLFPPEATGAPASR